jgi:hypothetical protein
MLTKLNFRPILFFTLTVLCVLGTSFLVKSAPSLTVSVYDGSSDDILVEPGATNVLLGYLDIGLESDDILVNGSSYVIAEGDQLSELGSNLYFIESPSSSYDPDSYNGAIIRSTNNTAFDTSDEIIIPGTFDEHASSLEEDSNGTSSGWIDEDGDEEFDVATESFIGIGFNASSVSGGDAIRLFGSQEIWITVGSNSTDEGESFFYPEDDGGGAREPSFINDNDADGHLSAGDTVARAGVNNVEPLDSDDNLCFDGSINADSEFDYTDANNYEVIWWDAGGDCSSFDTGVDVIITGKNGGVDVAPTGSSTEFGSEAEIGFIDIDEDATYACSRGGTCQEIVYTGSSGTNWTSDGGFTLSTIFFDPSSEGTDGYSTVGDDWYSAGYSTLNTLVDLSVDETSNAEFFYAYIDSDADTSYDLDEPIIYIAGSPAGALNTGDTFRLFGDYYKYFHLGPIPFNGSMFFASSALVESADTVQDAGDADGSSGDVYHYIPGTQGRFTATGDLLGDQELRYYDHDSSGSLAAGDDIIDHVQDSGYYNQITVDSVELTQATSEIKGVDVVDAAFSAIRLYTPATTTCSGDGTDDLIGADLASPFLGAAISVSTDPSRLSYSDNNGAANRICIYADVASDADLGQSLEVDVDEVVFESSTTVTSVSYDGSANISVYDVIDLTVDISPGYTSQSNTLSFSTTFASDTVSGAAFTLAAPLDIDLSSASMTCEIDSVSISGSTSTGSFGPLGFIVFVPDVDTSIPFGDSLDCSISGVDGPDDAGTYEGGIFQMNIGAEGARLAYDSAISYTFTDEDAEEDSGDSGGGRVIPLPTYDVTVLSPNGGETLFAGDSYAIRWDSNPEVQFVNLHYSLDGGESYELIVEGFMNTGLYNWVVPETVTNEGLIKVESTNGVLLFNLDVSDKPFSVVDDSLYLAWQRPVEPSTLFAGEEQSVIWTSSDSISEIMLEYFVDEKADSYVLLDRSENLNSALVVLPDLESDRFYMRLTGYTDLGQEISVLSGPFTLVSESSIDRSISITYPDRRNIYTPGEELEITWDTEGDLIFSEIFFTADGSKWSLISPFGKNNGSYVWTIPEIATENGSIRVSGYTSDGLAFFDELDESFWIVLEEDQIIESIDGKISLLAPSSGSQIPLSVGGVTVSWDASSLISSVALYLLDGKTGERIDLVSDLSGATDYFWSFTDLNARSCDLYIEGYDDFGNFVAMDYAVAIQLTDTVDILPDPFDPSSPDPDSPSDGFVGGGGDADVDSPNVFNPDIESNASIDGAVDFADEVSGSDVSSDDTSKLPSFLGRVPFGEGLQDAASAIRPLIPVLTIAYSAVAGGLLALFFGIVNIIHFLFNTPFWLLWKKKEYKGLVFDSLTHLPIPFATIRFYDAKSEVLKGTAVSDRKGRYIIRLDTGSYKVEASKEGYAFPSSHQEVPMSQESLYIYRPNEILEVTEPASFVRLRIGMDALNGRSTHAHRGVYVIGIWMYRATSFLLACLSLLSLVYAFSVINLIFFSAQVVVALGFYYFSTRILYMKKGQVLGGKNQPIQGASVHLFSSAYNKMIETQLSSAKGEFGFIVGPGSYLVQIKKEGYTPFEQSFDVTDDSGTIAPLVRLQESAASQEDSV